MNKRKRLYYDFGSLNVLYYIFYREGISWGIINKINKNVLG